MNRHPVYYTTQLQQRLKPTCTEAVRILTDPFIVAPRLIETTVQKLPSSKLHIRFAWDGKKSSRVEISNIEKESPFYDTPLNVGHIVLAINSVAILDPKQAVDLVQSSENKVSITTICPPSADEAPFCKLVAAATARQHPGIIFNTCRERCLVQVSRVFSRGPFAGTHLRQGDVVLAVNGVPVSTPEQAEKVLRQSVESSNTVLYVVDMANYRQSIMQELQSTEDFRCLRLERVKNTGGKKISLMIRSAVVVDLEVDYEKQTLVESKGSVHLGKLTGKRRHCKTYGRFVDPFLNAFNTRMGMRMEALEEAVFKADWEHKFASQHWSKDSTPLFGALHEGQGEHLHSASSTASLRSAIHAAIEPPFVVASLLLPDEREELDDLFPSLTANQIDHDSIRC